MGTRRETWYVLEDGSFADPAEVMPDDKGVLRHKTRGAVALHPDGGPKSSGVDVEEERAKAKQPKAASKDMKPDDHAKRPYRTRESKAE